MTIITQDIKKAIKVLNENNLVAIPTETVYGLAGNIYNEDAVNSIFKMKNRPNNNPLIVHIKSVEELSEIAKDIPLSAHELANYFWPGPLTLVLQKQDHISKSITAGKETVAVRVPNHPITLELLNQLEYPLAAPSANPFGSISPTNAFHVFDYFQKDLEIILDGGICSKGIESTIIGFEGEQPILYRHGSIPIEDIEKMVGKLKVYTKDDIAPNAPGMSTRHYAPNTKSILVEDIYNELHSFDSEKIGLLQFQHKINSLKPKVQYILSPKGDFQEASKNLYAYLHEMDSLNLDIIIIEKLPDFGLGKSINDRLKRAVSDT